MENEYSHENFTKAVKALKDSGLITYENEIADALGVPKEVVSKLKKGVVKLKGSDAIALMKAFPGLNLQFLRFGIGLPVELEAYKHLTVGKTPEGIPYYDIEASAGPIEMFQDSREVPVGRLIIPGYQDCDFSINVWGDSMYPAYKNGDIIACKEIRDKSIIAFGQAYLVITRELRLLKFIQRGPEKGSVILRSDNDKFDDIEMPRDAIIKLYLVKGKITRDAI